MTPVGNGREGLAEAALGSFCGEERTKTFKWREDVLRAIDRWARAHAQGAGLRTSKIRLRHTKEYGSDGFWTWTWTNKKQDAVAVARESVYEWTVTVNSYGEALHDPDDPFGRGVR
ncbi:MAG: hypothetical protein ABIE42_05785 [Candidatus Eisenbacteria bacterium]